MPLLLLVTASIRSTSRATRALSARKNLAALFSNPAKTATYAMSATPRRKINMSAIDANKKLTESSRYMLAISNIENLHNAHKFTF
jgi:hypothetical protein